MEERKKDDRAKQTQYSSVKVQPKSDRVIEPVAAGRVKKEGLGEKFTKTFLAADLKSVGNSIFFDTLVPAIKRAVDDIIENAKNTMLWGDRAGRYTERRDGQTVLRRDYNRMYDERGGRRVEERSSPRPIGQTMELEFDSRPEAEMVFNKLVEDVTEFGLVSVNTAYRYAKIPSDYTKEKYGWQDMEGSRIYAVRSGFVLELPRPQVLD